MGCLRRLGCLVLLVILVGIAWLYRDRWLEIVPGTGGTSRTVVREPRTGASAWEPLTADGAARARDGVQKLASRSGPVYANFRPGDLAAYIFQELSHQLPPSAEHVQAAAIGDLLYLRATVRVADLGGTQVLGPLVSVLGDRAPVQLGGTMDVVRPGLAEYHVRSLKVRDVAVPSAVIPRLVRSIERRPPPAGVAADALPLTIPTYIGDVRVRSGKVTLYKSVQ